MCCTAGQLLDTIDLMRAVMIKCGPCKAVLDYTGNPDSAMRVRDIIEKLEEAETDPTWCQAYFQIQDAPSRGQGGAYNGMRRYGAFYLITSQTYKEIQDNFRGSFPTGVMELKTGKLYVTSYKDRGSVPNPFAILQDKNPNHGYGPDYEKRVMDALKGTIAEHHNINAVPHTYTMATGKRVASVQRIQHSGSRRCHASRHR
jgi:hypothetical protein